MYVYTYITMSIHFCAYLDLFSLLCKEALELADIFAQFPRSFLCSLLRCLCCMGVKFAFVYLMLMF